MLTRQVFAAPVASGFIMVLQGWQWMYWYCTIFTGITFVAMIFCYEETKYATPLINAVQPEPQGAASKTYNPLEETNKKKVQIDTTNNNSIVQGESLRDDWVD